MGIDSGRHSGSHRNTSIPTSGRSSPPLAQKVAFAVTSSVRCGIRLDTQFVVDGVHDPRAVSLNRPMMIINSMGSYRESPVFEELRFQLAAGTWRQTRKWARFSRRFTASDAERMDESSVVLTEINRKANTTSSAAVVINSHSRAMERGSVNRTVYLSRIRAIHQALGIPDDYGKDTGLPAYMENEQVVMAGKDLYNRDLFLTIKTSLAWNSLRLAAGLDGISLLAVSGFRSVERQRQIVERKIKSGASISVILAVNAAPGYSQHHTGCAIDLTDSDSCEKPLEEDFESKPAFAWLMQHARDHGLHLEYTRNNPWGFIYEPWHWVFSEIQKYTFFAGGAEGQSASDPR